MPKTKPLSKKLDFLNQTSITDERGQIIFGLLKIMKAKKIKYFILENVKGLLNHKQGQTFKIILDLLEVGGYKVIAKKMDSSHYGLPHRRERIYFIGIRKDLIKNSGDFYSYFHQQPERIKMNNIRRYLIDEDNLAFTKSQRKSYKTFLNYLKNKYNKGVFSASDLLREEFLIVDTRQSDLRLYRETIPTLRTGRHGLLYVKKNQFRRLSGYESLLLQGFPKKLAIQVKNKISENQILSQSGNAMTVNVVRACGKSLLDFTKKYINHDVSASLEMDFKIYKPCYEFFCRGSGKNHSQRKFENWKNYHAKEGWRRRERDSKNASV